MIRTQRPPRTQSRNEEREFNHGLQDNTDGRRRNFTKAYGMIVTF